MKAKKMQPVLCGMGSQATGPVRIATHPDNPVKGNQRGNTITLTPAPAVTNH